MDSQSLSSSSSSSTKPWPKPMISPMTLASSPRHDSEVSTSTTPPSLMASPRSSIGASTTARVDRLVADVIGRSEAAETAFLLIADSLYTWASDIAMKHSIVHVSLWTGSAATFAINYNLAVWEKDPSSYDGNSAAPPTATKDNNILQNHQEADAVMLFLLKIVEKAFNQVKKSDFVLCNTVQALEPETLSTLNQNQTTYAIGPINFFAEMTQNLVQKSLFRQSDCTKWLDSKPPDSVLYISFGSVSRIDNKEIWEIAHGLLVSKVNFIWVITLGPNETDVFPPGFSDHVRDRGLIIPWCNQDMVLSNRAVGGFLTHCGWNSVLESVWYCVPMICRPISIDQPMNRKLVVEDWKIGVDLCHDGGHVAREEVANKIEILMMGEEFIALRQELKNASKKLKNALEIDGSSRRNFDQFVLDLKAKLYSAN